MVSTMTGTPCRRELRMAHGPMISRAPPRSVVAMSSLYRTGPGVHHATSVAMTRGKGHEHAPRQRREPNQNTRAGRSREIRCPNQPDQREQRGHRQDREQRFGQRHHVVEHDGGIERGHCRGHQGRPRVVEVAPNLVDQPCRDERQHRLGRSNELKAVCAGGDPEAGDESRVERRAQRGRPAPEGKAAAIDQARRQLDVVAFVGDSWPHRHRAHQQQQPDRKGPNQHPGQHGGGGLYGRRG